jgi:hypothetical protein
MTIQNITKIYSRLFSFGNDHTIQCIKVAEWDDEFHPTESSYTFDFDISLDGVELVLWLKRFKDDEANGWKMENNLVDGSIFFYIKDLHSLDSFMKVLQKYLDEIEPEIKRNFF